MNFSTLKELMRSRFQRPKTEQEYLRILEYLAGEGIVIGKLYQELEMSSSPVSFHRDISYVRQGISLHSHSFYEIMFCRSADRVEYLVGANRYRLSAGDLILVSPRPQRFTPTSRSLALSVKPESKSAAGTFDKT